MRLIRLTAATRAKAATIAASVAVTLVVVLAALNLMA